MQHLRNTFAMIVFSTFFHNNRLCFLFCILTNSIWNFRANFFDDKFWNFLNDAHFRTFSTICCLKFSNKFFQWRIMYRCENCENERIEIRWFIDFKYDVKSICKICDRTIDRLFEKMRRFEYVFSLIDASMWNLIFKID